MAESVRLVVWDLDETYWNGTLTEGGIRYNSGNHDLVIELARRGIMSTVCSKNDFETVKAILVEKGIWDYFIFPSISWTPKGSRIQALIEDVQLRPESVLFVDDNPQNLREAEHYVPGLQTAGEDIIPQILNSAQFKGKNDVELSRLKQYKLLETKKVDEKSSDDNHEFLRSCNIRVTLEHDVEAQLDRAIELINRTNQLNFTKKRLPEDIDLAREKLKSMLSRLNIQSGLVHVADRYGDYGQSGFYLTRTVKGRSKLVHFCFSCRILNMGVENWLYQRMGRPDIDVVGEVLSDLSSDVEIDWINNESLSDSESDGAAAGKIPRVIVRGACAVSPLVHYFHMGAKEVIGEFNTVRDGAHQIRLDHSLMLRYAIDGLSAEQIEVFRNLGFVGGDLSSRFADRDQEPAIRVLSSWVDLQAILYRHKQTGLLVPYKVKIGGEEIDPLVDLKADDPAFSKLPAAVQQSLEYLRSNFEFVGALPIEEAERNFRAIANAVPEGSVAYVISVPEEGKKGARAAAVEMNSLVANIGAETSRLIPIVISDIANADEKISRGHFHRDVYYRLFKQIQAARDLNHNGNVLSDRSAAPIRSTSEVALFNA